MWTPETPETIKKQGGFQDIDRVDKAVNEANTDRRVLLDRGPLNMVHSILDVRLVETLHPM